MVVQSPTAASVALVHVEGENSTRGIALRGVLAGEPFYIYGEFATQRPYLFKLLSPTLPVTGADLAAAVPRPLQPSPFTCNRLARFGEEEMASRLVGIASVIEQCGGDAVLASDWFVAAIASGQIPTEDCGVDPSMGQQK